MKYLVDFKLVLDVLEGETDGAKTAMALFKAHRADELVLAPTSYVALSPSFMGMRAMQDRFLDTLGVKLAGTAPVKVMDAAYSAWSRYQQENPADRSGMGVFERLYIGAYALLFDGILTRDGAFYRAYYKTLRIVES